MKSSRDSCCSSCLADDNSEKCDPVSTHTDVHDLGAYVAMVAPRARACDSYASRFLFHRSAEKARNGPDCCPDSTFPQRPSPSPPNLAEGKKKGRKARGRKKFEQRQQCKTNGDERKLNDMSRSDAETKFLVLRFQLFSSEHATQMHKKRQDKTANLPKPRFR